MPLNVFTASKGSNFHIFEYEEYRQKHGRKLEQGKRDGLVDRHDTCRLTSLNIFSSKSQYIEDLTRVVISYEIY